MSKDWTPAELTAASSAMKKMGYLSYEEFCSFLDKTYNSSTEERDSLLFFMPSYNPTGVE